MAEINYYAMSNFEFKKVVEEINNCVQVALKCGGKLFGGYLRFHALNDYKTRNFSDVNLWLPNETISDWIKSFNSLNSFVKYLVEIDVCNPPYKTRNFSLMVCDSLIARFSICVNTVFPEQLLKIQDFQVSTLDHSFWSSTYLEMIFKRETTIKSLKFYNPSDLEFMERKFFRMGWKISTENGVLLPLKYNDDQTFNRDAYMNILKNTIKNDEAIKSIEDAIKIIIKGKNDKCNALAGKLGLIILELRETI